MSSPAATVEIFPLLYLIVKPTSALTVLLVAALSNLKAGEVYVVGSGFISITLALISELKTCIPTFTLVISKIAPPGAVKPSITSPVIVNPSAIV